MSPKLVSFWRGPYTVIRKLSDVVYEVDCGRNRTNQTVHCDRLRLSVQQVLVGEERVDGQVDSMIDIEPGSESNTVEVFDDQFDQATGRAESNECVDELDDRVEVSFHGRKRKPPALAKDYVFSIFSGNMTKMAKTNTTPRKPLCPMCRTLIPAGERFEDHLVKCAMTKENVICWLCDKVFKKQDYLQKHLKIQHGVDNKADKKKSEDAMSTCSIGEDPCVELDFTVENEEQFDANDQNMSVGRKEVALMELDGNANAVLKTPMPLPHTVIDEDGLEAAPTKRKATSLLPPGIKKRVETVNSESLKKKCEIIIKQDMTELSKRHSVTDGEDVFANSVLVRRDMATGINSFNIGQYLRARNICPSSLRIELGDNGRVRFEFDME
ncbi:hypothetical protein DPMN_049930 [Dreissena polymorpha]|uniref:C2H2-type domain-containing protein n=1 Tax=Dreissena polymorpha TaxID=45954 RepID=A0A9D4HML5_DREPO|nr:hypothetical protein DPMN_049930 [Dreissena polymorpha]